MNQLLSNIQSYINTNELFDSNDKLLLTVSGGIDSVFMVRALQKLCYNISVAHCNFNLRGQASDDDEIFVRDMCQTLDIPFYSKKFDTSEYADTHQVSIQMAARTLRYNWFFELLNTHKLDYILTAHHANDQVETVLFNITKGSSIAGIRGIAQKEQIKRPLLAINKEEIKQYATQSSMQWREDVSNSSNKYHRNSIRNEVIPLLKKINPSIEKTFQANTDRFIALEKILRKQVFEIKKQYFSRERGNDILSMPWFDLDNGSLVVLDEILKEYGFNFDQTKNIAQCLRGESGKKFESQSHEVIVDRSKLYISIRESSNQNPITVTENTKRIDTPHCTVVLNSCKAPIEITRESNFAYLDADLITYPITIRKWQSGDSFIPLGMKGKKKLSDFMIDHKIPVNLKKRLLIFESKNKIIWVEGMRIDDRFKVTSNTKNVLIIKSVPNV